METAIRFQALVERLKKVAHDNPDIESIYAEFRPISIEELLAVKNDFNIKIEDQQFGYYTGDYHNILNEEKPNECDITIYLRFQNKAEYDLLGTLDKILRPETV